MFASYPPVRNRSACSTRAGVRASPSRSGSSPSSIRSRLIRSCTLVFYIAVFSASVQAQQDDPDELYGARADLAKAHQAADIWSARLAANRRDFESAWKLARADYWLGTQSAVSEPRGALKRGAEAGRTASNTDRSLAE